MDSNKQRLLIFQNCQKGVQCCPGYPRFLEQELLITNALLWVRKLETMERKAAVVGSLSGLHLLQGEAAPAQVEPSGKL